MWTVGFFDIIKMLLFGVIEGLTEWIPVSNTGHLAVAGHFLHFGLYRESETFRELFNASASLGAVAAAMLLFLPGNSLFVSGPQGTTSVSRERTIFWGIAVVSFLPTLFTEMLFAGEFAAFAYAPDSLRNLKMTVVIMIVGGLIAILGERRNMNCSWSYEQPNEIPPRTLFFIGLTQIVSFLPGASRFGIMVLVAVALGVRRSAAVTTVMLMSIPTLLLSSAYPIVRSIGSVDGMQLSAMLTVAIVAFFVSFFALREIVRRLCRSDMRKYGRYRIAFGVLLLLFSIL